MLPKKNRTDKKTVENIFKYGNFINSAILSFKFAKSGGAEQKISFIVPKSVSKLATKRNLLRRRGYEALSKILPSLPAGISGVLIFKKYEQDIPTLSGEIKSLFNKMH